jgi:hypothetical protein
MGCSWPLWVKAGDGVEHPTVPGTGLREERPSPEVSSSLSDGRLSDHLQSAYHWPF